MNERINYLNIPTLLWSMFMKAVLATCQICVPIGHVATSIIIFFCQMKGRTLLNFRKCIFPCFDFHFFTPHIRGQIRTAFVNVFHYSIVILFFVTQCTNSQQHTSPPPTGTAGSTGMQAATSTNSPPSCGRM